MTGSDSPQSSTPPKSTLHPAYTVTDIQKKVRVLDGSKVSYAAWVSLFTLHARGYKVLHHIDGTKPPAETDPLYDAWYEIDALVLQWIYGTMSDDLLPRILEPESTAQEAWDRVQNIFLNNKGARAASLEHEFNNLKLASLPSFDAYCQRLRELAGALKDVGAAINDQRLVLQLVRGLPKDYDTVAAYINQTLPNFETARSMIELENHRRALRDEPAVLVAPNSPPENRPWDDQPKSSKPRHHGGRKNNGNGSSSKGGNRNQKQSTSTFTAPTAAWGPMLAWPGPWTPPPCPYPTHPGWTQPWQPWHAQQPPSHGSRNNGRGGSSSNNRSQQPATGQAYVAHDDATQATDLGQLGQAFQAMSMQHFGTGPFYMDTGASSHLSADAGFSEWESDSEEQQ
ncbi:uncharacterized protein LOC141645874 [Silene latifolia]|uniref:uncharacterized protein LOC141645874 n=1 Tax=Silene latifolia TaxID=37657 RepID=UPI003D781B5B